MVVLLSNGTIGPVLGRRQQNRPTARTAGACSSPLIPRRASPTAQCAPSVPAGRFAHTMRVRARTATRTPPVSAVASPGSGSSPDSAASRQRSHAPKPPGDQLSEAPDGLFFREDLGLGRVERDRTGQEVPASQARVLIGRRVAGEVTVRLDLEGGGLYVFRRWRAAVDRLIGHAANLRFIADTRYPRTSRCILFSNGDNGLFSVRGP
ncbi:hypothetical protein RCH22_000427 [Cryobacterium psychrotolerans]|nr:hypothetical protein [Cryobacterium psychrotolerans]